MELTWIIKQGLYVCLQVGMEVGVIQFLSEIGVALLFSSITRLVFFGSWRYDSWAESHRNFFFLNMDPYNTKTYLC